MKKVWALNLQGNVLKTVTRIATGRGNEPIIVMSSVYAR